MTHPRPLWQARGHARPHSLHLLRRRECAVRRPGRPGRFTSVTLLLLGSLSLLTGCQSYHWRADYAQAEEDARSAGKRLFVFYKSWLDNDSARMISREVLSDPKVMAEFQDTVNVLIDRSFGAAYIEYVRKYGVETYPTSIIVSPDGRYHVFTGFAPRDRFIEFVRQAKGAGPAASKPGGAKPAGS